ncbi:hypothetical protein FHL15_003356 [Xylaria flabelliformis]|uniref:Uncharacterized protein n=1 Tax=Xylaria flabelliformis TaxID=2512241 RepID=A0A553I6H2_9PEZI|nr:hypothetical protein FHL15_003356 [Xylaria flabelliformis]
MSRASEDWGNVAVLYGRTRIRRQSRACFVSMSRARAAASAHLPSRCQPLVFSGCSRYWPRATGSRSTPASSPLVTLYPVGAPLSGAQQRGGRGGDPQSGQRRRCSLASPQVSLRPDRIALTGSQHGFSETGAARLHA